MSPIASMQFLAIRPARMDELGAIRAMQERSLSVLGAGYYAREAILAFVALIGTVDEAVVAEGHFFVACDRHDTILGSAGWSQRLPGYERAQGADAAARVDKRKATVRSVFVDPQAARQGIASRLMAHVERDAARHGIEQLELMSTLSGLSLYKRLGWRAHAEKSVPLTAGLRFDCVTMSKPVRLLAANDRAELRESA